MLPRLLRVGRAEIACQLWGMGQQCDQLGTANEQNEASLATALQVTMNDIIWSAENGVSLISFLLQTVLIFPSFVFTSLFYW
jgi:hypothetical protein